MMEIINLPSDYFVILEKIKKRLLEARSQVVSSANSQLILLYWDIGKMISDKVKTGKWGKSVVRNISKDIQTDFPDVSCFVVIELKTEEFKFEHMG